MATTADPFFDGQHPRGRKVDRVNQFVGTKKDLSTWEGHFFKVAV